MSTPSPQGQCCVCGTLTKQRCSTCLDAGFDIFFCSKAHMKLVWPGHKLSCGTGTAERPFRFPLLEKDEVDILVRAEAEDQERFKEWLHGTRSQAEASYITQQAIKALAGEGSLPDHPPGAIAAAIVCLRQKAMDIRHEATGKHPLDEADFVVPPVTMPTNLARTFSMLLDYERPYPASCAYPFHEPRYIECMHRACIYGGFNTRLSALKLAGNADLDESAGLEDHIRRELYNAIDRLPSRYSKQTVFFKIRD
ncbi:hypothetical protein JCM8097_002351 [Rhodosporidiobolus ruineniae]